MERGRRWPERGGETFNDVALPRRVVTRKSCFRRLNEPEMVGIKRLAVWTSFPVRAFSIHREGDRAERRVAP